MGPVPKRSDRGRPRYRPFSVKTGHRGSDRSFRGSSRAGSARARSRVCVSVVRVAPRRLRPVRSRSVGRAVFYVRSKVTGLNGHSSSPKRRTESAARFSNVTRRARSNETGPGPIGPRAAEISSENRKKGLNAVRPCEEGPHAVRSLCAGSPRRARSNETSPVEIARLVSALRSGEHCEGLKFRFF